MSRKPSSIVWAEAEIAKKEREIDDLRAYIRVETAKYGPPSTIERPGQDTLWGPQKASRAHGSKKLTLLKVVAASESGLSTQQVLTAGMQAGLRDLRVENTSPQLSGCGKHGLLSLNGGVWRITDKGRAYIQENEAAP